MPNNRIIAACIALSFFAHLVVMAVAAMIPWSSRVAESVMVVDLADLPRAPDFLPPKPGIIQGGRPKTVAPPKTETRARPEPKPVKPPRVMEGRVPDLPVDPALPAEERFPQERPKDATAAKKPPPSAKTPPAASPGSSGKPARDLTPSLGKMVMAMGETASRGTGNSAGKTVGTGGKPGEKGGIVEEGGEGAHLTALNAPEIQYISYFAGIKRKIELVWGYPAAAAGVEGDVIVDFVIGRNGRLESVTLIHGSGNRSLDDEALGSIRKASPYDPIPSEYKIANLQIRAHFIYTVTQTRILR